ncbi:tetratricopeptide repeat protein [Paucibacter sp. APW11]|uniref:Tetratricopeptide repeat protein n=1 Tax=Roseateles aquae TaxID=3077235 RepID=A0ABU3PIX8_9BURK|nr:tetratricopeptide repeat protein [Paucibacter sp. APW11]MDT9002405.1 tetratricopeptide repeat protein [Paucibacter sp. APW11]
MLDARWQTLAALALLGPALWLLQGCVPDAAPASAAIESLGLRAQQTAAPEALARLSHWAEQGSAVAQRELALALLQRPGREAEGLAALQAAGRGGDAQAAWRYGEAQRLGQHGLRPDAAAARPWLARAAELHHAEAALALARMARNGDAGPQDLSLALHWLQEASAAGSAPAMFLLANAYAQGEGTPVDPTAARLWLERAADHHYPPALQGLALALENGELGLARDPQQARELLKEASEERRNRWQM